MLCTYVTKKERLALPGPLPRRSTIIRQPPAPHTHDSDAIELPEILSALSFALDLTEGADPGHAVRSTLLGMRLGSALCLPQAMLIPLYYSLQLKDVGCSSNAARMAHLFGGDDRQAKSMVKLTDWSGLLQLGAPVLPVRERLASLGAGLRAAPRNLHTLWSVVLPGAGVRQKMQRILRIGASTATNTHELIQLRCDRGASILRKLRMSDLACDAVLHLDERWDGNGYPHGLAGQAIPVLSRISAVAQHLDVFATAEGAESAIRTLARRSGTWYDPEIVHVAVTLHEAGLLWTACEPGSSVERSRRAVVAIAPEDTQSLRADEIDVICEAFADVVDAKSPFTFRHSLGVRETSVALSHELGLDPARCKLLERAALLHDVGKLGVPNSILDKPARLTPAEFEIVQQHPGMSRIILGRIGGFSELARIAGEHHERLDGSGYPDGLTADHLSLESRLLSMADCFAALAEGRPYRAPLPLDEVLAILERQVPHKLDGLIFEALKSVVSRWTDEASSPFPPAGEHAPELALQR